LQKWFIPLLLTAVVINAGGLIIPILEPDGSLYATISKTIAHTGDFINLRVEGRDWLDKPHFPFWMAAISFRLLGVTSFAYKFPALLFWGAGAFYTWRLARSLYGNTVAQLATLVYVSAAHLVISNNDVRAEPYLTGLVIGAVYHFYKVSLARPPSGDMKTGPRSGMIGHLIAGSLLAGCACMTKGPFVLITIGSGFILDWIIRKEWDQFRNVRWWIAIALTALFTLPELYCLYVQFDLHPEKQVFGHTGVSGIRFFFWDSQFGRFFNTGPIKGSGDPFFYFHTLLWAFLPWSLLLYAAVVRKFRRNPTLADADSSNPAPASPASLSPAAPPRRRIPGDWICLGGALASFVVFSLSRFQLPHYLNILFPFFAILTADYLYGIRRPGVQKIIRIVQDVINVLLPVLVLVLCWFFHFDRWLLLMILVLALAVLPFLLFRGRGFPMPIARSFWMAMLVFAFVNFSVYPTILRYQAGTQAGHWLETASVSNDTAYLLQEAPVDYSFEFDCKRPVSRIPVDSLPLLLARSGPALVFAPSSFADTLALRRMTAQTLQRFPNFHVSQLTGPFVNYRTRASVLTPWSIFLVGPYPAAH
jgi:4-amino-4-deoxy-L-arabinose transferase-like glycosyltransferase